MESGESSLFSTMFSNLGLETDFGIETKKMDLNNGMDVFKKDFDIFNCKDSQVIHVKDDQDKFEVSLDTSQYRPDEIKVLVREGAVTVEGKHEEISEDGEKLVSRQFSRKYSLPAGAKPENVVSNLSSDGVLLISVAKTNLEVISTNGQVGSPKATRVPVNLRDTFFNDSFFKSNWEEFENLQKSLQLRSNNFFESFLEKNLSSFKENNCCSLVVKNNEAHNQLEQNIRKTNNDQKSQEITPTMDETNVKYLDIKFDKFSPRRWMIPMFSKLDIKNTFKIHNASKDIISYRDDDTLFELKMDISEYEPEEVKVTVSPNGILIEGNHEEKSVEGKQIISRSFTRKYSLPHGVRQEDVISKFASNHILSISAKKQFQHSQQIRIIDQSKDNSNSDKLESYLMENDPKVIFKNVDSAHNLKRNVKIERVLGTSKYKMNTGNNIKNASRVAEEKYTAKDNEVRNIDHVKNADNKQDAMITSRKDVPINVVHAHENKPANNMERESKIEKKLDHGQTNIEIQHDTKNIQVSKQKKSSVNIVTKKRHAIEVKNQ
jgi:HSP20 family molecular chaperone IbpA